MTEAFCGQHQSVLFDLDGTLIDTAPDMARVLADMLRAHGYPELPYDKARSVVSNGSLGLIQLGFPDADSARQRNLQQEYLDRYEQEVCRDSMVFPGLLELIGRLEELKRPWGIVTNKPARMTDPLLAELGLSERTACAISGDTLPERKPDPTPLLYACELAGVEPSRALYVGDAERDIAAGRAAGMATIAAAYGYITDDDDPSRWNADAIAADTHQLTELVAKAVNLPPDE